MRGWTREAPDNWRDRCVFLGACFLAQAIPDVSRLDLEIYALAREFAPHWTVDRAADSTQAALRRARRAAAGEEASRRYERGSMLVISNRSVAEWDGVFGDAVIATAILDRLLHHSHFITVLGDSYRLRTKRRAGLVNQASANSAPATNESSTGGQFSMSSRGQFWMSLDTGKPGLELLSTRACTAPPMQGCSYGNADSVRATTLRIGASDG